MTEDALYLIGDSRCLRDLLPRAGLGTPKLILTSPPYFDIKNYGDAPNQIGHKQTYQQYLNDVAGVLQQCYQLSGDEATLWLVIDTVTRGGRTYPLPFDLDRTMTRYRRRKTWILRDIIIWNKYKNIPWHAKGRFRSQFEYILFFSKGEDYAYHLDRVREIADYKKWWLTYPERYNPNGKPPSDVWDFTIPIRGWGNGYQRHLCPFPFPLVERVLSLSSDEGDLILDPFAGSGSVIALARQMNRRAIGIDINPRYKEQFETEVVVGARKYWERRKHELQQVGDRMQLFKGTNQRLRKIKASMEAKRIIIERMSAGGAVFLAADVAGRANELSLIVCLQPRVPPFDPSRLDGVLKGLEREYKVRIHLDVKDRSALLDGSWKGRRLFAYSGDRIYSYEARMSVADILSRAGTQDRLYSDIEISIDKPDRPPKGAIRPPAEL